MKLKTAPFLPIVLMSLSLLLLLLFQVVWLQKVYDEKYELLHRETDAVFRETMLNIQDSLVRKSMKLVKGDSLKRLPLPPDLPFAPFQAHAPGRVIMGHRRGVEVDSVGSRANVQVYINSTRRLDSSDKVLSSIAGNVRLLTKKDSNYNFIVKLDVDSISVNVISRSYQKALTKANIPLEFQVVRQTGFSDPQPVAASFRTIPFSSFPTDSRYQAYFPAYRSYLVRKCLPQAFFSSLLMLVTSFSFWVVYRNFQRQRRLNQLKNDFINNITHELKTPITTVGVALEALSNFNAMQNPAQAHDYLDISKQELNRLNMMVDKILKAAVFENKGLDLEWEPIDMKQLLEQVHQSMQLYYGKMHAQVKLACEGQGFAVSGDTIHLTNVVYNLIDNALKYSQQSPSIHIVLRELLNRVELSVTDNGIGIESEFHQKIFERFFRVPTGNVHNAKGYGLGLNYVAQVVEKHHGLITVQSELGKGSCFVISLPKLYAEN